MLPHRRPIDHSNLSRIYQEWGLDNNVLAFVANDLFTFEKARISKSEIYDDRRSPENK
jgi:hypothetical protein